MESSQCPQQNKKIDISTENDDDLASNIALKSLDVSSESNTNEDSLILEISGESNTEIDVENNTILTDAEVDNNNNTVNETMDAPEDNTVDDSNTVHNYFKLKKQMRDKILAKRLMARRKYISRPSLNQSSLLDYFSNSKLPFKRVKSEPKTSTSGYFTRSKNSSFSAKGDYTATLNLANSTLMSDSSPVNVTTNSVTPEAPVNPKHRKLKNYIFKYCLKCNETSKNDDRVKYCGKCRLMLKYKCVLCEAIYGTRMSSYGHLSKHSKKHSEDLSEMYSTVYESGIDNTTNGMEDSLSNEEAALNNTNSGKHYNYICMKCKQTYESTKKCIECQTKCLMRCIYCDKTYNSVAGIKLHVRQVHNAHLPRNTSANASAIDTSQNIENMPSSRKRKMTTNVSEADIVKDFEDFPSSRKRKIVNDGSMLDTSNNVIDELSSRKRKTVNNNRAVTVTRNVTKNDKSIKNSNSQNSAYNITKANEVEEFDVKTCMFLNCLTCNLSIQKHDGNIIPCTICNVNMVMKCYFCNDYVNTADEVENHIRIHMAHDRDYTKCLKCLKSMPKAYITAHLPLCKRQVVLFSCKFCDFKTRNHDSLIYHALKQHAENKNLNKYSLFKALDDSDIEKQGISSSSGKRGTKRKNKNTALYLTSIKGRVNRMTYQCEICSYTSQFSNNLSRHIIKKHLNDSGCDVIQLINETYNADLDGTSAPEQQDSFHSNEAEKAAHSVIGDDFAVDSTISTSKEKSDNTSFVENTSLIYRYCSMCKKLEKDYDTRNDNRRCENCKCIMQYKCIKCEKLYTYYGSILYHMNSKCSIQRRYKCNLCDYITPIFYLMRKHVKNHNKNSILSEKIQPQPSISSQPKDKQSTEIQTPEEHQNNETMSQVTLKKIKKKCPKCHSKITVQSYHDQFCGKEPTMLCNFCPFKTKYRSNLIHHCKLMHSSDRKVKVISNNLKNNATTNEDAKNTSQPLQLHISSAETDKYIEEYCVNCGGVPQTYVMKPMWKCKKCKINLLFRCTKCNVMYPKRELLARHVKRHLLNTYRCTNCSKSFGILENLKKHEIICKSRTTN